MEDKRRKNKEGRMEGNHRKKQKKSASERSRDQMHGVVDDVWLESESRMNTETQFKIQKKQVPIGGDDRVLASKIPTARIGFTMR